MCFSSLIQIFPSTHAIKAPDRTKGPPFTINLNQARPKIEYSKQDLIALRHNHVNLTGLPAGTISNNKENQTKHEKKLGKPNIGNNSSKLESTIHNLHQVQTVYKNRNEIVNTVRVAHVNARSIKNKDDLIAEYIDSTKVDFTIITKTWLQDNEIDKGWVSTTSLNNSNYKISTENHKTCRRRRNSISHERRVLCQKAWQKHNLW